MEYPSPLPFTYPSTTTLHYPDEDRAQPSLCAPNEAKFHVDVKVKRAFSFEELQSGSYFKSLDESDFQFLRVYGQPVLIPLPDDPNNTSVLHNHVDEYPPIDHSSSDRLRTDNSHIFTSKSYTLENSLGESSLVQSSYVVPQTIPSTSTQWQPIDRVSCPSNEVSAAMIHSSTPYSRPNRLYPQRDHESTSATTAIPQSQYIDEKQIFKYDEQPPMDSLPYPPPQNSASPPYFHPSPTIQNGVLLDTSSYIHDAPFQFTTTQEEWEDVPGSAPCFAVSTLRGQQAPFSPPQPQHYASSYGHSRRRRSRSPSPRSQHHMSPIPHSRRSLDKKPALACLFCRGRKIACGPPIPGSKDKTCNQCARRHLKCEYPLESRRGMRKRRSLIPRATSAAPEISPDGPKVNIAKTNRKRSTEKTS
ncbi:hypothetical protein PAXRUDRAFT_567209 [Paxillus rubicundulus Ve08.2h10]|uniref:Zn(2)-C6 fungal-type domain-containing protein n=1 Tax=Paxillus rubicundulus Ve08.2h10 TaxID=930991 RepID=A0A0D0D6T6_9AGAM|nr:hypothetical protein PAXRUDRAFT_567209 [Paxillus rubicundulus Ve08.2h10]